MSLKSGSEMTKSWRQKSKVQNKSNVQKHRDKKPWECWNEGTLGNTMNRQRKQRINRCRENQSRSDNLRGEKRTKGVNIKEDTSGKENKIKLQLKTLEQEKIYLKV